jgi:hypothetical protein
MPERSTKVLNGHVSTIIELGLRVSCLRSPDSVRVPTDSDPTGLLRVLASWRLGITIMKDSLLRYQLSITEYSRRRRSLLLDRIMSF